MGEASRIQGPAAGAVGRLLSGDSLDSVFPGSSLAPRELIAAIGEAGLEGLGPGRPALVRERPINAKVRDSLSERVLASLFPNARTPVLLALSAGLLLIHDFWDDSHEAAQRADDLGERRTSAYWHGIAHRREPDPGNASYWFRRVGQHEIFPKLAAHAKARLAESPIGGGAGRVVEAGAWNPSAMIELCGRARTGSAEELLALDLQREEMRQLLRASLDAVEGLPA